MRRILTIIAAILAIFGAGAICGLSKLATKEGRAMSAWECALSVVPFVLGFFCLIRFGRDDVPCAIPDSRARMAKLDIAVFSALLILVALALAAPIIDIHSHAAGKVAAYLWFASAVAYSCALCGLLWNKWSRNAE